MSFRRHSLGTSIPNLGLLTQLILDLSKSWLDNVISHQISGADIKVELTFIKVKKCMSMSRKSNSDVITTVYYLLFDFPDFTRFGNWWKLESGRIQYILLLFMFSNNFLCC